MYQSQGVSLSGRAARAIPATMAGSDSRCGEAGRFIPRDRWTMLMESSTDVRWTPLRWWSFSVRPRHGRMSAARPCTTWLRFSFVLTCTVRSHERSAAYVAAVSGAASAKLPPMATNTFTSPSRMAWIVRTVSSPCSRGGSIPHASASRSRNASVGRWSMPQVRLPWTLLWPRTGEGPAPSRPMLPRSSRRLTISRTVSTPCSCWVRPRHQLTMERSASVYTRAALRMSARLSPDWRSSSSQGVAAHSARYSSKPAVCRSTNVASSAFGSLADCSRTALAMPRSSAMSPPMRGWRLSVLVRVDLNRAM